MKLSGIVPFTLLDYPGKVACVVFTPGCNMRCSYCHNSEFVLPEKLQKLKESFIPEEVFFHFLEKRKGLLQGVSICGGEPTIYPDLGDFCKKVKEKGFLVKLDTNGTNPQMLRKLIEEDLVDFVAMDMKQVLNKIEDITKLHFSIEVYEESVNILREGKVDYEFRTTIIRGEHSREDILGIAKYLSGVKKYVLQNFRPGETLDPNFAGKSFSQADLEDFIQAVKEYIPNTEIRN